MTDFNPGDTVDVVIKGVRIANPTDVSIIDEHGTEYPLPPQAAISRMAPAEWPPQAGDLWRDRHGELWFISSTPSEGTPARMVGATADGLRWTDNVESGLLRDNAPLTLVHRESPAVAS